MPDMRDAIAQYLAYTGQRMPQGGMPGMGGGMPPDVLWGQGGPPVGPPGPGQPLQPGPSMPQGPADWPAGMPPPPQSPPSPDCTGPQGTNAPPVPSNLQGFQQLPSGQFMPGGPPQGMPDDTIPPGGLPGMPPIPNTPPVDTPMQAPQQVGGMDPAEWYRMYTGGR